MSDSAGLKLPFTIPFNLSQNEETGEVTVTVVKGFTLPFTIPFSLNTVKTESSSGGGTPGFTMPFTIPFVLGNGEAGGGTSSGGKIKKSNKVAVYEKAWYFTGIIFEENVVAKLNSSLVLQEDIKSRILLNVYLIDRNHIKLEWYGGEVNELQVYKKLQIDDKYEKDGDPIPWENGSTIINISDDAYDIVLKSPKGEGESGVINMGDTFYVQVQNALNIALNRKIYYINVDFKNKFEIKVDF